MIPHQLPGMVAKILSIKTVMSEKHLTNFLFLHDSRVGSQSRLGTGLPWIAEEDRTFHHTFLPSSLPLTLFLDTLPHQHTIQKGALEKTYKKFWHPLSPWRAYAIKRTHTLYPTPNNILETVRNHPHITALSIPSKQSFKATVAAARTHTPLMI